MYVTFPFNKDANVTTPPILDDASRDKLLLFEGCFTRDVGLVLDCPIEYSLLDGFFNIDDGAEAAAGVEVSSFLSNEGLRSKS